MVAVIVVVAVQLVLEVVVLVMVVTDHLEMLVMIKMQITTLNECRTRRF